MTENKKTSMWRRSANYDYPSTTAAVARGHFRDIFGSLKEIKKTPIAELKMELGRIDKEIGEYVVDSALAGFSPNDAHMAEMKGFVYPEIQTELLLRQILDESTTNATETTNYG